MQTKAQIEVANQCIPVQRSWHVDHKANVFDNTVPNRLKDSIIDSFAVAEIIRSDDDLVQHSIKSMTGVCAAITD